MNRLTRTINVGLATALLAMLLTFGGLTLTRNGDGLAALLSAGAVTAVQTPTLTDAALNGTPITENTSSVGQREVVDARYAVRQAGPAVVTIISTVQQNVSPRGRFGVPGQRQTTEASGSGVIVDSKGYIITNQHVIANTQGLQVIFADGTKAAATVVGEDAGNDIAVIKVDVAVPAVAQLGDSDALELGEPVVAIGTALGDFANTVTEGIVSGLHRQLDDASISVQDLIQTDAAINHGNSGGPLLDLSGKVIGINTAVVRNDGTMGSVAEGLGFAIPSNTAKSVMERLISAAK